MRGYPARFWQICCVYASVATICWVSSAFAAVRA